MMAAEAAAGVLYAPSSIDFCEENYAVSESIAEFWNAFSSLLITVFGVFGALYSNQRGTNEARFAVAFAILAAVGLGSFLLHSSLFAWAQALDEVPMLYQNLSFMYILMDPTGQRRSKIIATLLSVAFVQTLIYFTFRALYWVFLVTYISLVVAVVLWLGYLAYKPNRDAVADFTRRRAVLPFYQLALLCYVGLGATVWVIDMNFCSKVQHLQLHMFWHIFAGFGTYCAIEALAAHRVVLRRMKAELTWHLLPYVRVINKSHEK